MKRTDTKRSGRKIGRHATAIYTVDGTTYVQYHRTDVVAFNADLITLKTGGWRTATTKTRMNQASAQFDLGFGVFQKDFDWFVNFNGQTIPFDDETLELPRK